MTKYIKYINYINYINMNIYFILVMSKQIFRQFVPPKILFDILEKVCIKTDKYYLFDLNAYRKLAYYELYNDFAKSIVEYYHISKREYVDRKLTYKSFVKIIRQICKSNNIQHTSQIKYNESNYNIDYYIYFR